MQNCAFIIPRRDADAPCQLIRQLIRHFITWMLVLGALLLSPGFGPKSATAQEAPVEALVSEDAIEPPSDHSEAEFLGLEHRREIYEASRLTVAGAVGRNLLLPGLGNIYTEQYFYAGLAFSFLVFAASFVSYGLVTDQSEFLWFGAGTAGIAYIGSVSTSVLGVEKYNRERREGLKVEHHEVAPRSPFAPAWSPSVNVGWRF